MARRRVEQPDPLRVLGDPEGDAAEQYVADAAEHLRRVYGEPTPPSAPKPPKPPTPPGTPRPGPLLDWPNALLLLGVACLSLTVYWLWPPWTPAFVGVALVVLGVLVDLGAVNRRH